MAKLVRFFKKSRDQWKNNALEKQKRIRALETKERDLLRSREKWKLELKKERVKFKGEILKKKREIRLSRKKEHLEVEKQNKEIEKLQKSLLKQEEQIKELQEKNQKKTSSERDKNLMLFEEAPAGHHFSLGVIQLAIDLVVDTRASLRGAAKTFQLFSRFFEIQTPSHCSIRSWLFRLGLYILKYQTIPYRSDWILIFDHTVELDHKKCLVTLLISYEDLEKHGYSLEHCHVIVVDIEVMTFSTGDLIYQKLLDLRSRVGNFLQIVCDHGPDLQKGIRLYQEKYPEVISTYDVTHKMGCVLKKYFEKNTRWISFSKHCSKTIPCVQQTELRFLVPPKQKAKARYLNIHEQINWAMDTLDYEEYGDFSQISPPFQFVKEELDPQIILELSTREYSALSSFPSQSYSNRSLFEKALREYMGNDVFEKIKAPVMETADRGRKRYFEKYSWLSSYKKDLISYSQVIQVTKIVGKQVKKEGIHQRSKKRFEEKTKNLLLTSSLAKEIKKEVLLYLDEEGKKIPVGTRFLGTSDLIESIIGKYKSFPARSPIKELGKLLLTIPVFTTKITASLIKKAMEKVKNSTVEKYSQETFGVSTLSKRKTALSGKSEQKMREKEWGFSLSKANQIKGKSPIKGDQSNPVYPSKKSKKVVKDEENVMKLVS